MNARKQKLDSRTLEEVSHALRTRYLHQRELGRIGDESRDKAQGVAAAAQAIADSLLDSREERIAFLQNCGCAFISGYPDRS